jgi:hypothetical protein
MPPYFQRNENFEAFLLNYWLTDRLNLFSQALQEFDHAIVSMWPHVPLCLNFLNNSIPLEIVSVWNLFVLQDTI